jgi:hypothetical protein
MLHRLRAEPATSLLRTGSCTARERAPESRDARPQNLLNSATVVPTLRNPRSVVPPLLWSSMARQSWSSPLRKFQMDTRSDKSG